jgi:pteridine reductase
MESNRVALVTGGARRVGLAIVERLLAAGFDVIFTYRTSAAEAQRVCATHGSRVDAVKADLERPAEAIAAMVDAVNARGTRLDLLVNSASIYEPSSLTETNPEQIRRFMTVHVEAPLLLVQALAPKLRASRGHVVNMVDLLAEKPWPKYLAYSASKAALVNLTLGLARELAPEVTVNGIAPGVVEWPDEYPQSERDKYLKRVPLGRAGTPQDVAELVHFLATAGSYITGQIIRLDGGRSIT